jgi:hypothetical protein
LRNNPQRFLHNVELFSFTLLGFRISHTGINTNFSRFGRGIYFAHNSSKANDYNGDATRAILHCKVVAVKEFRTQQDQTHLTSAPEKCHSVCGVPGERLNYPELVVYHEHAVKPICVILYTVNN